MDEITIRAVRPDDAAGLTALHARPAVRHGTLRLPYHRESFFEGRIKNLAPTSTFLVACAGETLVGEGGLRVRSGRQSHSGDLLCAVHDAYWGRGIGRALCEALLDVADNWLGLRRIQLEAYADNDRAIALYRSLGFEHEGLMRAESMREGALMDVVVMGRLRDPVPYRPHHAAGSPPNR